MPTQPQASAIARTTPIQVPATTVELPQLIDAETAARAAIETFKGFVNTIDNDETYRFVGDELLRVKSLYNKYKRDCNTLQEPFRESKRVAQNGMGVVENYFNGILQLLATGERILKTERERWELIETRRVTEERRLLAFRQDEDRRRVEEENRKRAEAAEAEARQRQAEADQLARKRDTASKEKAEELRRQAEQIVIDAAARNEMETDIATLSTSTAHVEPALTRTAGISSSERRNVRFTDARAVLQGILGGQIPAEALRCRVDGKIQPLNGNIDKASTIEIPLDWFRRKANDLGDTFDFPGVKSFMDRTTSVRG